MTVIALDGYTVRGKTERTKQMAAVTCEFSTSRDRKGALTAPLRSRLVEKPYKLPWPDA